jgi:hypothetical protein
VRSARQLVVGRLCRRDTTGIISGAGSDKCLDDVRMPARIAAIADAPGRLLSQLIRQGSAGAQANAMECLTKGDMSYMPYAGVRRPG